MHANPAFSDTLFALLAMCVLIAAVVFAVMLHSIATFRKGNGVGPAAFIRSALVETLWAIVPVAILFGAAAPAVREVMQTRASEFAFAMSVEHSPVQKTEPSDR